MIVTYFDPKSEAGQYFSKNLPYAVMAISTKNGVKKYWLFSDEISIPIPIDAAECRVVDSSIPDWWAREGNMTTYPEGLREETKIQYVMWDDDSTYPAETANALRVFLAEYRRILEDYVGRNFGGLKEYMDYKLDEKFAKNILLHKERGYEFMDKTSMQPPAINQIPLREIVGDVEHCLRRK